MKLSFAKTLNYCLQKLRTGTARTASGSGVLLFCAVSQAAGPAAPTNAKKEWLVQFTTASALHSFTPASAHNFGKSVTVEPLGVGNWALVRASGPISLAETLRGTPGVAAVQPNYKIHLIEDYRIKDPAARAELLKVLSIHPEYFASTHLASDKPELPAINTTVSTGADPLADKQWGMIDIGASNETWKNGDGKGVVVAVIDTGVDYTHEDLVDNLWRNPGESGVDAQGHDKSNNGIDDDANGFVDDVIGWDFNENDNKPFDVSASSWGIALGGGNPGHGTHCAGNVAARAGNGKGIAGVAPEAQIMALRFLGEKGEGDTAGAIKAINYAVKMGAKVLSNSWGSEGEDTDAANNQALRDAISAAEKAGVLFVAAAGNGHGGTGYDNDSDPKPGYPASYPIENIVSVAAIDKADRLGSFSNWGAHSVHLAAPGVAVFSTMVNGNYGDVILDILGIKLTWDGTSMAAPHVAGAAALYWSKHPQASYKEVKAALISSVKKIDSMTGKSVSGGKLNVSQLMAL